ncbi:hypothetical protein V6N13_134572 [Hibiscus sabdariffa]
MLVKAEQEHKANGLKLVKHCPPYILSVSLQLFKYCRQEVPFLQRYIDVQIRMDVIAISKLWIMLSPSILHMMIKFSLLYRVLTQDIVYRGTSIFNEDDKLIWKFDPQSKFSVKSVEQMPRDAEFFCLHKSLEAKVVRFDL